MVELLIDRENNASEKNEISDPEVANGVDFSDNEL